MSVGFLWDFCCMSVVCCCMSVGFLWYVFWCFVVFLLDDCGVSVGFLCDLLDLGLISVGCLLDFCWISVGFLLDFCWVSVVCCCIAVGFLWYAVVFLLDLCGMYFGCLCDVFCISV